MAQYSPLSRLQREIDDHLLDPSISIETKQWVRERRRDVREEYERVARDGAYHDFVLSYLQREATKFKAHKRDEEHPYDGTRTTPVCSCDNDDCPLKREQLPGELIDGSLAAGVREFRHAHPGHPIVLDDAMDAWADLVADVEDVLMECVMALANDEIPVDERTDEQRTAESTSAAATSD